MNDQAGNAQDQYESSGSNSLGLAGFIVSLVGFIVCGGVLCPIGLVMSLIALRKQPRGFAIAGVVLGSTGTVFFFLFGIALMFVILAFVLAAVGMGLVIAVAAIASNMGPNAIGIYEDIDSYYDANGRAPAILSDMGTYTPDELTDAWGAPIRYEVSPDGQEIWLRSDGKDQTPGTDDDLEFYRNFQTDKFHFKSEKININK